MKSQTPMICLKTLTIPLLGILITTQPLWAGGNAWCMDAAVRNRPEAGIFGYTHHTIDNGNATHTHTGDPSDDDAYGDQEEAEYLVNPSLTAAPGDTDDDDDGAPPETATSEHADEHTLPMERFADFEALASTEDLEALIRLLNAPLHTLQALDPDARNHLLLILIGVNSEKGLIQNADDDIRLVATRALRCVLMAGDSSIEELKQVIEALIGSNTADGLIRDRYSWVRVAAIKIMGDILTTDTLAQEKRLTLVKALADEEGTGCLNDERFYEWWIREAALKTIGRILLTQGLASSEEERILLIETLLGKRGGHGLIRDMCFEVRKATARILGQLLVAGVANNKPEREALIQIVWGTYQRSDNEPEDVFEAMANVLGDIVDAWARLSQNSFKKGIYQYIQSWHRKSGLIQHDAEEVRITAVDIIGSILISGLLESEEERTPFIEALVGSQEKGGLIRDRHYGVRTAGAEMLGEILISGILQSEEARAPLIEALIGAHERGGCLQDKIPDVCIAAIKAIKSVLISRAPLASEERNTLIKALTEQHEGGEGLLEGNQKTYAITTKTLGRILASGALQHEEERNLLIKELTKRAQHPNWNLHSVAIRAVKHTLQANVLSCKEDEHLREVLIIKKVSA